MKAVAAMVEWGEAESRQFIQETLQAIQACALHGTRLDEAIWRVSERLTKVRERQLWRNDGCQAHENFDHWCQVHVIENGIPWDHEKIRRYIERYRLISSVPDVVEMLERGFQSGKREITLTDAQAAVAAANRLKLEEGLVKERLAVIEGPPTSAERREAEQVARRELGTRVAEMAREGAVKLRKRMPMPRFGYGVSDELWERWHVETLPFALAVEERDVSPEALGPQAQLEAVELFVERVREAFDQILEHGETGRFDSMLQGYARSRKA